jgi:hypothetical protein
MGRESVMKENLILSELLRAEMGQEGFCDLRRQIARTVIDETGRDWFWSYDFHREIWRLDDAHKAVMKALADF